MLASLLLSLACWFGQVPPGDRVLLTKVLHNGFEGGRLVRNHTVVHYRYRNSQREEGFVTVTRFREYVVNEERHEYGHFYEVDTLCTFAGTVKGGRRTGTFLSFPPGTIFYLHHCNGVEDGEFKGFYYVGQLYCEGVYRRGARQGTYRQYYANGRLAVQEQLLDAFSKVVRYEEYYLNGKMYVRGYFSHQVKVNEWQYFDAEGLPERKEYYSSTGRLLRVKK